MAWSTDKTKAFLPHQFFVLLIRNSLTANMTPETATVTFYGLMWLCHMFETWKTGIPSRTTSPHDKTVKNGNIYD